MIAAYTELHGILADFGTITRHGYALPRSPLQIASPIAVQMAKPVAMTVPIPADLETGIELAEGSRVDKLEQLAALIKSCRRCGLCNSRNKAIPGTGSLHPQVMVIGEVPGSDEDKLGLPFVGAAGQFLDKWLEAIGLSRYTNVFMTSLVRCKTPDNREPTLAERTSCAPYLDLQIELLNPVAILTVGSGVASWLSREPVEMAKVRGQFFEYLGIPWMPIHHPSAVLRDPELKRPVWEDLKNFKQRFLLRREAES